jgi:hypothetical protein
LRYHGSSIILYAIFLSNQTPNNYHHLEIYKKFN